MSKEIRNLVITAVIALFVGYMAGSIMQTGVCPITGTVICKDTAAACESKKKECANKSECKKEAPATEAPAVDVEAAQ